MVCRSSADRTWFTSGERCALSHPLARSYSYKRTQCIFKRLEAAHTRGYPQHENHARRGSRKRPDPPLASGPGLGICTGECAGTALMTNLPSLAVSSGGPRPDFQLSRLRPAAGSWFPTTDTSFEWYASKFHRHFDARYGGAIGCVSLVEKRVLNAGSDGGNQCNGANSSHFSRRMNSDRVSPGRFAEGRSL
jgi:hypothetical protein